MVGSAACVVAFGILTALPSITNASNPANASNPTISSTDGDIMISADQGKHFIFQEGDQDPIYLDQIPEELRTYSDASLRAFGLGLQARPPVADAVSGSCVGEESFSREGVSKFCFLVQLLRQ
jgi:hypothetical protein